jgi:hypothetical protein
MRVSREQVQSTRASSWPAVMMLDGLLDGYVDWRESADAVADAYARWSFARGLERSLRFAAYVAAIDREQQAAGAYADAVEDVERWLLG